MSPARISSGIFKRGGRCGKTGYVTALSCRVISTRFLLLWLLLLCTAFAAEPEMNYLRDADLSGARNDTSTDWKFNRGGNEGKVVWGVAAEGGADHLFIRKRDDSTHDHCWWGQRVAVRDGDIYRLSFAAKSSGEGDHGVAVGVDFYGAAGQSMGFKSLKTLAYVSSVYPTSQKPDLANWTDFSLDFTVPRGAAFLSLRFALDAISPSEAAFRNIRALLI